MIYTVKSIGSEEPKLKEILKKQKNMSEEDKDMLKNFILKNLHIPKN